VKAAEKYSSRAQAMLDNTILIDPNTDTYVNPLRYGYDLIDLRYALVTHAHIDHFYPDDLYNRMIPYARFASEPFPVTVYGSEEVTDVIKEMIERKSPRFDGILSYVTLHAYEPITIEKYTIVPLPAVHTGGAFVYQISADGKPFLYGNDSGVFQDEVFDYWKANGTVFDFVSLDCTEANRTVLYTHHMNPERNIEVRNHMLRDGSATPETRFCCTHFSHNGIPVLYEEFLPLAKSEGFDLAYDGMTVTI